MEKLVTTGTGGARMVALRMGTGRVLATQRGREPGVGPPSATDCGPGIEWGRGLQEVSPPRGQAWVGTRGEPLVTVVRIVKGVR